MAAKATAFQDRTRRKCCVRVAAKDLSGQGLACWKLGGLTFATAYSAAVDPSAKSITFCGSNGQSTVVTKRLKSKDPLQNSQKDQADPTSQLGQVAAAAPSAINYAAIIRAALLERLSLMASEAKTIIASCIAGQPTRRTISQTANWLFALDLDDEEHK